MGRTGAENPKAEIKIVEDTSSDFWLFPNL